MVTGPALAVILAAALTWYVGSETVKGVKWVSHHVKTAVHKIVHPHEAQK